MSIRQTKHGFWVIEGDQWISKWAEDCGDLAHDTYLLNQITPLIPEGGVVVDVGAFIGDHTIAYARRVGPNGNVWAFEPNPEAFQCLQSNLAAFPNVCIGMTALSDKKEIVDHFTSANAGANYLRPAAPEVKMSQRVSGDLTCTFDGSHTFDRLDFVKIDAEGFELKILRGMRDNLHRLRPKILVEINTQRLLENGANVFDILSFCKETMGDFVHAIIPKEANYGDPQYDLLIEPKY